MRVGVHCSVRNGFVGALRDAAALGCDALQMFTQSPRGWKTRVYEDDEFARFRAERARLGLTPIAVHSPYLPNLCTSDPDLYNRSVVALKQDLERCEKLGAEFLVIHPGAFSPASTYEFGAGQLVKAINEALDAVKGAAKILVENVAGGGRRVGSTARELADILGGVRNKKRVGVCFDTCHAYGAGYDLASLDGVRATLEEFDKAIGLDAIEMFHVNDSKGTLRSHRDMHEHIGKGHVGEKGLGAFLGAPAFRDRTFILETPKNPAPASDVENLRRLRSFFDSSPRGPRGG